MVSHFISNNFESLSVLEVAKSNIWVFSVLLDPRIPQGIFWSWNLGNQKVRIHILSRRDKWGLNLHLYVHGRRDRVRGHHYCLLDFLLPFISNIYFFSNVWSFLGHRRRIFYLRLWSLSLLTLIWVAAVYGIFWGYDLGLWRLLLFNFGNFDLLMLDLLRYLLSGLNRSNCFSVVLPLFFSVLNFALFFLKAEILGERFTFDKKDFLKD